MTSSTTSSPHLNLDRTNEDWVAALTGDMPEDTQAQSDLREYVKRGLGRSLGDRMDNATLEDVTQDAMIRITAKIDQFRGDSRFTTWAMAIAIRIALTELRSARWGGRSLEDLGIEIDQQATETDASDHDPSNRSSRTDLLDSLQKSIETDLTPRQRAAVLGELAGMPTSTLAGELGTNSNALYKLHHDARLRLRAALEKRGYTASDVRSILSRSSNR